jgi:hypothetical protein
LSLPGRADQIHSYHPPIPANGLYWTTELPPGTFEIADDFRRLEIQLTNLEVQDEPKAPLPGPGPFPAIISMKLTLLRKGFEVGFTNPPQQFHLEFSPANASVEFQATTPSLGFSFTSAPAGQSETLFAIMGTEQNGVFF